MKHLIHTTLFTALFLICLGSTAQDQTTLAEKLGYAPDTKLLIIHADDIGLAQSVNQASIIAYENRGISSGSIMVPCPWTNDFASYYKENSQVDVGIPITLTAEWDFYKWGGIQPRHLDTHMGSVLATPELVQIYMKLGMEYQLPVFVPRMMMMMGVPEEMKEMAKEELVLVDRIFMLNEEKPGVTWLEGDQGIDVSLIPL